MKNNLNKTDSVILKDSIFRVGKVYSVEGRLVKINVDKQNEVFNFFVSLLVFELQPLKFGYRFFWDTLYCV